MLPAASRASGVTSPAPSRALTRSVWRASGSGAASARRRRLGLLGGGRGFGFRLERGRLAREQRSGLFGRHAPHLARRDPDAIAGVDQVRVVDLLVVLPDRRPHPGRAQVGLADVPERVAADHDVDAARTTLCVVADARRAPASRWPGRAQPSPFRPGAVAPSAGAAWAASGAAAALASAAAASAPACGAGAAASAGAAVASAAGAAAAGAAAASTCGLAAGASSALAAPPAKASDSNAPPRPTRFEILIAPPPAAGPPIQSGPTAPLREAQQAPISGKTHETASRIGRWA